ncbi:hypothetical protein NC653_008312 [Populus alba x Populus x berolinensis]|uniref:Uncharacterized protein n=1 Tax=Populus alba x Populus x berolinensis TaxID=444605 RepID=A0AAD6W8W5_9ROSI|nr:hypothetical protein NC653_008312 [Populus alba x Populus x berolinensis]
MMKLSRLLNSNRNAVGKPTDVRDGSALHALTFQAGISTGGKSSIQDRVFAPYSVFKGKAALSVEPVLPTFSKFGSGNLRVDRRGSMMLTFLPAIGERKYDYEKRQKFALSATEVGSLISTGPKDSCEFFHDPSMLSSYAIVSVVIPSISKQLIFSTAMLAKLLNRVSFLDHILNVDISQLTCLKLRNSHLTLYHMQLLFAGVVNNILKTTERFTVPVTTAEFTVLKTACSFALPHIMGWDRLTTPLPGTLASKLSKVDPQMPDLEWDK